MTSTNPAAWAWCCELLGACTRRGRTLALVPDQDGLIRPTTFDRDWRMRFHPRSIAPVASRELGRDYLQRLRSVLRDVATASWRPIVRSCDRAVASILDGGSAYLRVGGQYLPHHIGGQLAGDPEHFVVFDHDGSNPEEPVPGPDDFVLDIGGVDPPGTFRWGEPELLRGAGRGVAWVISDYLTKSTDLVSSDIVINQHWPEGDTLVQVPGYDVPLAPASGVVAEAIYWTIVSQVDADLAERRRDRKEPRRHTDAR